MCEMIECKKKIFHIRRSSFHFSEYFSNVDSETSGLTLIFKALKTYCAKFITHFAQKKGRKGPVAKVFDSTYFAILRVDNVIIK